MGSVSANVSISPSSVRRSRSSGIRLEAAITTEETAIRSILTRRSGPPGPPASMLRAILFDLDDTLFDHSHGAREALAMVHRSHHCFGAIPFEDFARAHAEHLETLHLQNLEATT